MITITIYHPMVIPSVILQLGSTQLIFGYTVYMDVYFSLSFGVAGNARICIWDWCSYFHRTNTRSVWTHSRKLWISSTFPSVVVRLWLSIHRYSRVNTSFKKVPFLGLFNILFLMDNFVQESIHYILNSSPYTYIAQRGR